MRCSLSATAAARVMRLSAMPAAIFATVVPLHGTITIASNGWLPEAGGAARSSFAYELAARAAKSAGSRSVSAWITACASRLTTSSTSARRCRRRAYAYGAPDAPVTPTTTRIAGEGTRDSIDNRTVPATAPGNLLIHALFMKPSPGQGTR